LSIHRDIQDVNHFLLLVSGYGVSGLWWGLTVGLTAVLVVSLVQLVYVDWEKEVTNASHRVSEDENARDALRRVSLEWPVGADTNTVPRV